MVGHAALRRIRAAETARRKREETNRKVFAGFLKLPTELRNAIWDLVLPHDRVIDPFYSNCDGYRREGEGTLWFTELVTDFSHWSTQTAITQATRIIRDEAVRYYYGSNIFVLGIDGPESDELTKSWIQSRPHAAFAVMRTVLLGGWRRCTLKNGMLHMRVVDLDLFTLNTKLLNVKIENDKWVRMKVCELCENVFEKELMAMRKRRLFKKLLSGWESGEPSAHRTMQAIRSVQCYSKSFQSETGGAKEDACGEYYILK